MIRTIHSHSPYLVTSQTSDPYISSGQVPEYSGSIKYDSIYGLQVYNGNSWIPIETVSSMTLSSEAEAAIKWASEKMREDQKLEELCKKYPALQHAKDNFELIKALVQDELN